MPGEISQSDVQVGMGCCMGKMSRTCKLCLHFVQVIDTGHYCQPIDSDLEFYPLSKQIELEFLALVKSPINRQSDYRLAGDRQPRKPSGKL